MIRDAVFFELRKHVQGALGETPTDFDLATGSVCDDSSSTLDRDRVVSYPIDTCCCVFDLPEPEPMDTTEN